MSHLPECGKQIQKGKITFNENFLKLLAAISSDCGLQ